MLEILMSSDVPTVVILNWNKWILVMNTLNQILAHSFGAFITSQILSKYQFFVQGFFFWCVVLRNGLIYISKSDR